MGAAYCCESTDADNEGGVVLETSGIIPSIREREADVDVSNNSNISEDERRKEKARLKLLVRNFTSTSIRGVTCSWVDFATGKVEPAEYSIDRWLRFLTLEQHMPGGMSRLQKIEIGSIRDVILGKELPAARLPGLSDAVRQRLLILQFQDPDGYDQDVAIAEVDALHCQNFVTCMNILRLYAQV
eukprot:CAMPEP_0181471126 /NCGR_PEP_ID=MMETSP1110-20121109/38912_1 /TAXON_ID=174948 /ORGANISM="Symbiodinium sp., Strain CCMP421" /LENGTH=184 /DNA_ID=CAMNT_0023596131 /DNA_START=20 /DNA_END=571 /DNA_ORIENTATION=+